ncbi:MAG: P1 family peptidase, partial [Bryobacterales bacterium]|nr:P1 family peptidase [Bryobacterales bacterium]
MSKGLTDIAGIKVGHASDYHGLTGCTVILCEQGAVAGVDVRGSASGNEEFEVMNPLHVTPHVHAVTFAGGSAFGLEAASGVRRFLEKKKVGFPTGAAVVPLVPCAILFDLAIGSASARPGREMGEEAAAAATDAAVVEGCVGAGTGATVGKVLGIRHAMKSGIGTATVWLDGDLAGVRVSALAAVNALGDIRDPENGQLVAGARVSPESDDLADAC